jgi:putative flippase GtrA
MTSNACLTSESDPECKSSEHALVDQPDQSAQRTAAVKATFTSLLRHQLSSFVSGGVDFGTMIALVHFCAFGPTFATACAAAAGAVANFTLERSMVFTGASGSAGGQAMRYALVSAASLGLNALGEYVLTAGLNMQYVIARTLVAGSVSVLWNFPLHRHFVFRREVAPRAIMAGVDTRSGSPNTAA